MSQKIIVVDSQKLNDFQLCAYKYNLSKLQQIESIEKSESLQKGSLLHVIFEHYYKNNARDIEIAINAGLARSVKLSIDTDICDEVIYQAKEYFKYYKDDNWEALSVEEVGSKVLYESEDLKILYEFKIDMIGRQRDLILPWDHKSEKQNREFEPLQNQPTGYCWATGINSILINKVGFQKTIEPAKRFQRPILTYHPDSIAEWVEETIDWIILMDQWTENRFFPKNRTSCDKYGGCVFRDICRKDPGSREYIIERDYQIGEKWDVGATL